MLNIHDSNGNLDLSHVNQAEMDALPSDERTKLASLIAASITVEEAEAAAKAVEKAIKEVTQRRQDLLKRLPPTKSASDLFVENAKLELAKAAARRSAQS